MDIDAIIEVLRWANGQGLPVRLVLRDQGEVHGVPTSVDLHPTAHEVFLRPEHNDDTEIGISLGDILSAELV
ncbi:MAG: hypothetical protein KA267_12485 [Gemmatimonadales bacterium]|jgi:hypothetical protein|nr:hypothetical protein [Gemmatimonadales bacterium]